MATKKKPAASKVAATVSPEPIDQEEGGGVNCPMPEPQEDGGQDTPATDVDVFVAEVAEAAPAPALAPVAAKASFATTVVPAPAAASAAPVGSSGHLMGIQLGVETKAQHNTRLGAGAGTCGDIGWLLGTVA